MEARPWVDARRESSDHMRRFIWSAPDHNEKWSDLDDRYRRTLCHPGNWKVTEMWLKSDCIVTEFWLNFDWNVSERYRNGTTSVTFPELSINIPLQNSTVKSFILWTILFRYFISVSRGRVEIDAYLLFLYCTGSNIMIVSISGRRSGHYMYTYHNRKIRACCLCHYLLN